ncbi:MAG TPA: YtxH domain-containing protein [Gemmatimonadales bacterium]|nr:YtxH domain-containing protein [Gemmatimonadales bacterium]
MTEFDILDEPRTRKGGDGGSLGAIALAAAVGAGVALLFATEAGRDTRKRVVRKLRDLEIPDRVERLGSVASERLSEVRSRTRHRSRGQRRRRPVHRERLVHQEPKGENGALYAALGTVAGAAIAALLTPQGGRETREWIGHTFDDLRDNASLRWREHRARRQAPRTPADLEVERLNGSAV